MMSDKIDVLLTVNISEDLLPKLVAISPRLNMHVHKVSRADEIPQDAWAIAEVLYTGRIIPLPDQAPNLQWIQFHFTGVDHARDAAILRREGMIATTMSGATATQVAEHILSMLLALGRRLPEALELQRKVVWPKDRWERFSPRELRHATVGIVGYGSIGRQLARLLHAFGAQVFATKRDAMHPQDEDYIPDGFGDPNGDYVHRLYPAEALRSMATAADFLVVSTPLTPATRDLINADVFEVMKPTAYLVDISRGGVINQAALITALKEKKIAGAALDVFVDEPLPAESSFWKLPNVILTPHISGISPEYDQRAMQLFAENLGRYLAGKPLLNQFRPARGY